VPYTAWHFGVRPGKRQIRPGRISKGQCWLFIVLVVPVIMFMMLMATEV
jgi:hypothetical protein